jgi:hypothetical protein
MPVPKPAMAMPMPPKSLVGKLEKKLNMTKEEWLAKKKEIKYLRERIRKAKKVAEAREAQKLRKGKDAVAMCNTYAVFIIVGCCYVSVHSRTIYY